MKEKMKILTKSKADRLTLLTLLLSLGGKWHGTDSQKTAEDVEDKYAFSRYPIVYVENNKELGGYGKAHIDRSITHTWPEDASAIIRSFTKKEIKIVVKNVGDYEAVINGDNVKVGCQTISFDKIEEIHKAVQTAKNG